MGSPYCNPRNGAAKASYKAWGSPWERQLIRRYADGCGEPTVLFGTRPIMIRATRVANVVVIALWVLAWATISLSHPKGLIGTLLGLVLLVVWVSPYYFAWRGLASDSPPKTIFRARKVNIAMFTLCAFLVVASECFRLITTGGSVVSAILGILIWLIICSPLMLNIKALKMRGQSSEPSAR